MPTIAGRLKPLLLAAALVPALCLSAAGAESVFYSVQFAVFKDLRSVNRQVNALQVKEKSVFWEKATMPDTGAFYRVYLGRFATWEEAFEYGRRLQQSGAVDHFGIHWFTEPEPEKPTSAEQFRSRILLLPLRTDLQAPKERFVDHGNGTVTDLQTGLMWAQNGWRLDLLSALPWDEAVAKISEFSLAGHQDWRLPTIDELKGIYKTAPVFPLADINEWYWTSEHFTSYADAWQQIKVNTLARETDAEWTSHHRDSRECGNVRAVRGP